jgi:hypothetical protein
MALESSYAEGRGVLVFYVLCVLVARNGEEDKAKGVRTSGGGGGGGMISSLLFIRWCQYTTLLLSVLFSTWPSENRGLI